MIIRDALFQNVIPDRFSKLMVHAKHVITINMCQLMEKIVSKIYAIQDKGQHNMVNAKIVQLLQSLQMMEQAVSVCNAMKDKRY